MISIKLLFGFKQFGIKPACGELFGRDI